MIFFLYGLDDFRAKEKIREIKGKFLREVAQGETSVAELSGDDLTLTKFHEAVSANSLFARRRLIILEKVLMNKDKDFLVALLDYLRVKASSQDNILIFYEPLIALGKQAQPQVMGGDNNKPLSKAQQGLFVFLQAAEHTSYFKAVDSQEASVWVKARLAAAGLEIDYKALQTLISLTGNDLWSLNNEVNKLINHQLATGADTTIKTESVLLLVSNQIEEKIFALTDALSNKNKSLALKLLEEQLRQGVNEVYLLTMLSRQIKILLSVRAALDSGLDAKKIGALIKVHPYVLQKSLSQARNFNLEALKNIFNALIRLDYNYKSGKLPAPLMMTVLLANI